MKPVRFKFKLKYLAILGLILALLFNRGFRKLIANYSEYSKLQAEKVQLERQRGDLEGQLKDIKEKPAVEHAARKELGLIRPEETEYRFPPPKETDK